VRDALKPWITISQGAFAQEPDGNPIVILLDLKMPKMDGIQFSNKSNQIRTCKRYSCCPDSSRESRPADLLQFGVNAYVVKPVKFADFIEAVSQIGVFWR